MVYKQIFHTDPVPPGLHVIFRLAARGVVTEHDRRSSHRGDGTYITGEPGRTTYVSLGTISTNHLTRWTLWRNNKNTRSQLLHKALILRSYLLTLN